MAAAGVAGVEYGSGGEANRFSRVSAGSAAISQSHSRMISAPIPLSKVRIPMLRRQNEKRLEEKLPGFSGMEDHVRVSEEVSHNLVEKWVGAFQMGV
jgi:hypothetical protein